MIIPPDVDELTDDENIDEDQTDFEDVEDVAGTLELNPSDAYENYDEYLQTAKNRKPRGQTYGANTKGDL